MLFCEFFYFEPPDTSDQLQVLDIGLFGIQKKTIKKNNVRKDFNEQSKELIRIIIPNKPMSKSFPMIILIHGKQQHLAQTFARYLKNTTFSSRY